MGDEEWEDGEGRRPGPESKAGGEPERLSQAPPLHAKTLSAGETVGSPPRDEEPHHLVSPAPFSASQSPHRETRLHEEPAAQRLPADGTLVPSSRSLSSSSSSRFFPLTGRQDAKPRRGVVLVDLADVERERVEHEERKRRRTIANSRPASAARAPAGPRGRPRATAARGERARSPGGDSPAVVCPGGEDSQEHGGQRGDAAGENDGEDSEQSGSRPDAADRWGADTMSPQPEEKACGSAEKKKRRVLRGEAAKTERKASTLRGKQSSRVAGCAAVEESQKRSSVATAAAWDSSSRSASSPASSCSSSAPSASSSALAGRACGAWRASRPTSSQAPSVRSSRSFADSARGAAGEHAPDRRGGPKGVRESRDEKARVGAPQARRRLKVLGRHAALEPSAVAEQGDGEKSEDEREDSEGEDAWTDSDGDEDGETASRDDREAQFTLPPLDTCASAPSAWPREEHSPSRRERPLADQRTPRENTSFPRTAATKTRRHPQPRPASSSPSPSRNCSSDVSSSRPSVAPPCTAAACPCAQNGWLRRELKGRFALLFQRFSQDMDDARHVTAQTAEELLAFSQVLLRLVHDSGPTGEAQKGLREGPQTGRVARRRRASQEASEAREGVRKRRRERDEMERQEREREEAEPKAAGPGERRGRARERRDTGRRRGRGGHAAVKIGDGTDRGDLEALRRERRNLKVRSPGEAAVQEAKEPEVSEKSSENPNRKATGRAYALLSDESETRSRGAGTSQVQAPSGESSAPLSPSCRDALSPVLSCASPCAQTSLPSLPLVSPPALPHGPAASVSRSSFRSSSSSPVPASLSGHPSSLPPCRPVSPAPASPPGSLLAVSLPPASPGPPHALSPGASSPVHSSCLSPSSPSPSLASSLPSSFLSPPPLPSSSSVPSSSVPSFSSLPSSSSSPSFSSLPSSSSASVSPPSVVSFSSSSDRSSWGARSVLSGLDFARSPRRSGDGMHAAPEAPETTGHAQVHLCLPLGREQTGKADRDGREERREASERRGGHGEGEVDGGKKGEGGADAPKAQAGEDGGSGGRQGDCGEGRGERAEKDESATNAPQRGEADTAEETRKWTFSEQAPPLLAVRGEARSGRLVGGAQAAQTSEHEEPLEGESREGSNRQEGEAPEAQDSHSSSKSVEESQGAVATSQGLEAPRHPSAGSPPSSLSTLTSLSSSASSRSVSVSAQDAVASWLRQACPSEASVLSSLLPAPLLRAASAFAPHASSSAPSVARGIESLGGAAEPRRRPSQVAAEKEAGDEGEKEEGEASDGEQARVDNCVGASHGAARRVGGNPALKKASDVASESVRTAAPGQLELGPASQVSVASPFSTPPSVRSSSPLGDPRGDVLPSQRAGPPPGLAAAASPSSPSSASAAPPPLSTCGLPPLGVEGRFPAGISLGRAVSEKPGERIPRQAPGGIGSRPGGASAAEETRLARLGAESEGSRRGDSAPPSGAWPDAQEPSLARKGETEAGDRARHSPLFSHGRPVCGLVDGAKEKGSREKANEMRLFSGDKDRASLLASLDLDVFIHQRPLSGDAVLSNLYTADRYRAGSQSRPAGGAGAGDKERSEESQRQLCFSLLFAGQGEQPGTKPGASGTGTGDGAREGEPKKKKTRSKEGEERHRKRWEEIKRRRFNLELQKKQGSANPRL
ncbi:conserved hypothetical protein [Neospora caninum Liverpool]|uniref:Uncharacterized protein n=1 Tax=Neospora caninum (strain Liverpool) TaxID=572307 RepID=F0VM17_NEOCL|nr:conserved hypothetical protein [Neospora caninum Liverpool]CBZ54295.1 conserved hypothetical protein [Neospora caninum Liverpool]CEL69001.1 TPA: hypothetical protein BN1204_047270 [Neospora caninum Liverpool]|eukprot:XP_003884326.1 conserved hypothetical protein [Neospora caninum Liverpool]